ncbi:MAG: hypothetical protein LBH91_04075 [Prevotellaceae bacterium]|jgi:16S rRNA processing protein RimM|nr:hypothetical protein [Prevotellaceae bacterium]
MGKDSIPLAPFANVHKTFGANGELIIKLFSEAPEEINLSEPVFITIDGCPVPFFFKSFETRGNNRAIVIFDDVESMVLAEELTGKMVFSRQDCFAPLAMTGSKQSAVGSQLLIDYVVKDEAAGDIGIVVEFMDIPKNPCLSISNGNSKIIIPCQGEFIVKINHKNKIITTRLPEGLINLNQPS